MGELLAQYIARVIARVFVCGIGVGLAIFGLVVWLS